MYVSKLTPKGLVSLHRHRGGPEWQAHMETHILERATAKWGEFHLPMSKWFNRDETQETLCKWNKFGQKWLQWCLGNRTAVYTLRDTGSTECLPFSGEAYMTFPGQEKSQWQLHEPLLLAWTPSWSCLSYTWLARAVLGAGGFLGSCRGNYGMDTLASEWLPNSFTRARGE